MSTLIRSARAATSRVALVAGLLLSVIGTFLPWLRSGSALRNSYAADGIARRLLHLSGEWNGLLAVWPFISVACGLVMVVAVLGWYRIAAGFGLLLAVILGGTAVAALSVASDSAVRTHPLGPIVTCTGALIAAFSATVLIIAARPVRVELGGRL